MKNYLKPIMEVINLQTECDVITMSVGDNDYDDKDWE